MDNNPIIDDLFSYTFMVLHRSRNFKYLLSPELKQRWREELLHVPDCYNYHLTHDADYNLFKIILLAGHFRAGLRQPRIVMGYNMFKRLEGYMTAFPHLMEGNIFWDQLTSLDGGKFNLLFSKLTMAAYFKHYRLDVQFRCDGTSCFTDAPLNVYDNRGNAAQFQVLKSNPGLFTQQPLPEYDRLKIGFITLKQLMDNCHIDELKDQTIMIVKSPIFNLSRGSTPGRQFNPAAYLRLLIGQQVLKDGAGVIFFQDIFTDADVPSAMNRLSVYLFYDKTRIPISKERS
ncbi:hypothetical protein PV783_24810 [Chitinophaga sp. CC14]|uniref:hypothetical protein n=1 Tax=Chitinophaga sp. CC14 TaxID=3029199 RepID=UPI003B781D12